MGPMDMKRFVFWIILLTTMSCKDDSVDCIDPSKINDKAGCPYVMNEVCGCDGNTYSNSCVAENAGVVRWTDGRCH